MNVLALDTTMAACSVAAWHGNGIASSRFERMDRGHAETLMPMIGTVLVEAGLEYASLDRIAVTVGPGYFTGIRIGLAAARGLALATGLPLAGFTTLSAVAHGAKDDAPDGQEILVTLTSKRRDLYVQRFDCDAAALDEARAAPPDAIAAEIADGRTAIAGDGAARIQDAMRARGQRDLPIAGTDLPDAAVVARMAAATEEEDWLPAMPIYLRPADVTMPKPDAGGTP